jgi:prepilin-type N-terminal cleavage/methylation domain-containing protein
MKKFQGFTLIEIMVVVIILAGVLLFFLGAIGSMNSNSVSFGFGGVVETRCINGLEFTVANGQARQVYDQFGHGVTCK